MEISNRTLALFLAFAVIISIGGTFLSLNKLNSLGKQSTNYATTSTGTALLNITTQASIRFVVNILDFGAGYVNTSGGYTNCTMYVNDSVNINKVGCINFNSVTPYGSFFLENDGSLYVNLTLNCSANSTNFIGGNYSVAKFQYAVSNNESGSCSGVLSNYGWTDADKIDVNICGNLSYISSQNSLRLGVKVVIPYDAYNGSRTATFTATGTGI